MSNPYRIAAEQPYYPPEQVMLLPSNYAGYLDRIDNTCTTRTEWFVFTPTIFTDEEVIKFGKAVAEYNKSK